MQKWYSTLFHLSPPSRRKFLFTERSLEFQKSQIGPHLHLSLSRCSVFPPSAVRRPRARGQMDPGKPLSATWPAPWHLLARTRVPDAFPSRHDTPAGAAPLPPPPARRRVAQGQIDRPQTPLPSPRSSLAYKNPQSSTVARLLLLLPPPAAPPWPARSSSRGPAPTTLHCSIQPPQKLLHLPVELHAHGIEPNPSPDAISLLRRHRRARAHR